MWVSPQGHRSVAISFCRHRIVPVPCENGSVESTVAEGGRNLDAPLIIVIYKNPTRLGVEPRPRRLLVSGNITTSAIGTG